MHTSIATAPPARSPVVSIMGARGPPMAERASSRGPDRADARAMASRPSLDASDRRALPRLRRAPVGSTGAARTIDVQVGMDLLCAADVQESIDRLGERYL